MGSEAKKFATYEDLMRLPDSLVGEIISGELITSPRPTAEHSHASSSLGADIIGPFQKGKGGPGGWWILDEPEIHLQADILVPDLAGWRLDIHPGVKGRKKYHVIPPQWVCEVLSPSTAGIDRVKKLPIYARERVDHVWFIDPIAKTLEVYQRSESRWVLLSTFAGNEPIRAAPFDAIGLDLGALWLPD